MEIWLTMYVVGFVAMTAAVLNTPGVLAGLRDEKARVKVAMGIIVFALALVWPLTLLGAILGAKFDQKV